MSWWAVSEPLGGGVYCLPERLRREGHQLLDTMRDNTFWSRVKATIREKGLELSFDTIKLVAPWSCGRCFRGNSFTSCLRNELLPHHAFAHVPP